MNLGPHADFIVGAYAFAVVIIGGLVAWIVIDHRRQSRILSDLEERGVSRRSERGKEGQVSS